MPSSRGGLIQLELRCELGGLLACIFLNALHITRKLCVDFLRCMLYRLRMNTHLQPRIWKLAHNREIALGTKAVIMGILNVTPDSFSDGGRFVNFENAISQACQMHEEGAQIIDIGGESTRPGAEPVSESEEQDRILPVIEKLAHQTAVLLSVDTYRTSTARLAISAGAHAVNDVWGFQRDNDLASLVAETGAGACAMHTGRERQKLDDVIDDQKLFLGKSVKRLKDAGVGHDHIMLDPGFGFAKDPQENIQILARLEELHELGYPLLIGTSRKRFIGHFTGQDTENRDIGTAATNVVARMKGGAMFRVHDVPTSRDALAMVDGVMLAEAGS